MTARRRPHGHTAKPAAVELVPVIFAGSKHTPPGREIRAGHFVHARGPIVLFVMDGAGGAHRLNVNLDDGAQLEADEVAIKDYSENEGTLASLVSSGIVAPPHRHYHNGHMEFPICRLLVTPRPF